MNHIHRMLHALFGHRWQIRLVDERRAAIFVQFDSLAGAYATCTCGASRDDLSPEARAHFIRRGNLILDFAKGEFEVRT